MNRRTCLMTIAAGTASAFPVNAQTGTKSIALNVDLTVDPEKEKEMLRIFHTRFSPAAARQPGFVDAKMLKLRKALQGPAPGSANYRFTLRFQTEEQRQKWIATPLHMRLWPLIEATLSDKNYTVLLYDVE